MPSLDRHIWRNRLNVGSKPLDRSAQWERVCTRCRLRQCHDNKGRGTATIYPDGIITYGEPPLTCRNMMAEFALWRKKE